MSFFSAIGNSLSNAVESACDSILPKNLEFVGDLAGLATDIETGNLLKCVADFQDLTKDLPQQLSSLTQGTGAASALDAASLVSPDFEPSPPPPYEPGKASQGTAQAAPTRTGYGSAPAVGNRSPHQTAPLEGPVVRGQAPVDDRTVTITPSLTRPAKVQAPAASSTAAAAPTTALAGDNPAASIGDADPAAKAIPTAKATAAASGTAVETGKQGAASSPAVDTASAAAASGTAVASKAMSADSFFQLSDKALMDAVRNGTIPDSVSQDPDQMRRLQVRMNDITQMNQLITTMLTALHEMNKQVIQNLRV